MKLFLLLLSSLFCINSFGQSAVVVDPAKGASLMEAIADAAPFDTLLVQPGTFKEGRIIIDKPLFILGVGYPVIDGEGKTEIITILSDSVTIQGLQIQNVGVSYIEDRAGISAEKQTHIRIIDNKLYNTFFGVYLKNSSHCLIQGNEIKADAVNEISSGNAIQLWYCNNILVQDNHASGHRDGIYLEFVDDSRIENNTSTNNIRYGLHFMFSNRDQYVGNTFELNGAGVAVMFSKKITMQYNRFINNKGTASYGLLLKEIYDGTISNNTFLGNTTGIYGEGANRLEVHHNTFEKNGWALKVLGSCMDNTFTNNNFINNNFDLTTNNNRSYNNYDGNYWSDYTGYDLDKDGIGDVPHRPIKLFSYIVTRSDASIILLRSLLVDVLNFTEKVTPAFTPELLQDTTPLMKPLL